MNIDDLWNKYAIQVLQDYKTEAMDKESFTKAITDLWQEWKMKKYKVMCEVEDLDCIDPVDFADIEVGKFSSLEEAKEFARERKRDEGFNTHYILLPDGEVLWHF